MDHAEGFPLSQFRRQWRFVSHYQISFYYYCHGLILCIIIEFNSCFTVRSLIFVFRREIQKLKPEVFVFFRSFVLLILCFVLNLCTQ